MLSVSGKGWRRKERGERRWRREAEERGRGRERTESHIIIVSCFLGEVVSMPSIARYLVL